MYRAYAGVGSRNTPLRIQRLMSMHAGLLCSAGWTLRSGAADGADAAFELGVHNEGLKEIYLPWKDFQDHPSELYTPLPGAYKYIDELHPNARRLSYGARRLHARNAHQVLGKDLESPVEFVLCWTPRGEGRGGTGQAIRIARAHGISVYDYAIHLDEIDELVRWTWTQHN